MQRLSEYQEEDNRMAKNILYIIPLCLCILVLVSVCGCVGSLSDSSMNKTSASHSDPETGVQEWIEAVNNHNIVRLYDLEPDEVRQEISFNQFEDVNKDNNFISPNASLSGYDILNETSNATIANLIVVVNWNGPVSPNSTQLETMTIYYHFEEFFEDGEWKVWIVPM